MFRHFTLAILHRMRRKQQIYLFHFMVVRTAIIHTQVPIIRRFGRLHANPSSKAMTVNNLMINQAMVMRNQIRDRANTRANTIRLSTFFSLNYCNVPSRLNCQSMNSTLGPSLISNINSTMRVSNYNQDLRVEVKTICRLVPRTFQALMVNRSLSVNTRLFRRRQAFKIIFKRYIRSLAINRSNPSINAYPVMNKLLFRSLCMTITMGSLLKSMRTISRLTTSTYHFVRVLKDLFLLVSIAMNRQKGTRRRIIGPSNIILQAITYGNSIKRAMLSVISGLMMILSGFKRLRQKVDRKNFRRNAARNSNIIWDFQVRSLFRLQINILMFFVSFPRTQYRFDRRIRTANCMITVTIIPHNLYYVRRNLMNRTPFMTTSTRDSTIRYNSIQSIIMINRFLTILIRCTRKDVLFSMIRRTISILLRLFNNRFSMERFMIKFRRIRKNYRIISFNLFQLPTADNGRRSNRGSNK